ncbi:TPA: hypothetical protein ACGZ94_001331 [Elizabethkingia anophelis]
MKGRQVDNQLINRDQIENRFLLEKSKREIFECFGEGFNYYPDKVWFYIITKKWWGKKTALLLTFGKDDRVEIINIKEYYFLSSMIHV